PASPLSDLYSLSLHDALPIYRFGFWRRFTQLEVPSSMIGLLWNSMMSMAGGWFFLTIVETVQLGSDDYRLPGIGSYMNEALEERSEEHTSELQSRGHLVCRLL